MDINQENQDPNKDLVNEENEKQIDIEKLSPKAKKLLAKVDELSKRIKEEKNPAKVQMAKFGIRRILPKIQRELDLINLREDFDAKRLVLETEKNLKYGMDIDLIPAIEEQIAAKKSMLKSNKECDSKSSEFMYPQSVVEKQGGIEEFAKFLKESQTPSTKLAGEKIEQVLEAKKEIERLEKEKQEARKRLEESDQNYNKDKKALDREEKRLTIAKGNNILTWFADTYNAAKETLKDMSEARAEKKEIKREHKAKSKENRQAFMNGIKELFGKYKDVEQQLKEEAQIGKQEHGKVRDNEFLNDIKLKGVDLEKANEPVINQQESQNELTDTKDVKDEDKGEELE